LLEGKKVNLRIMEKEDLPLITEWLNNSEFSGEYFSPIQIARTEMEKSFESSPSELRRFIIEKKDGTKIGFIQHFQQNPAGKMLEVGYGLVPSERRKGYCSEAALLMVDYLFLSKDIVRLQAYTDVRNVGSQKVLEKVGFKKEGIVRKNGFVRGEWKDECLYSFLREEWKEPKILTGPKNSAR
jgi:RimJ/RimL family protein N-acetyltransferase